ncbi:hypothetical protein AAC387_Pa01g0220 [Persea americana]
MGFFFFGRDHIRWNLLIETSPDVGAENGRTINLGGPHPVPPLTRHTYTCLGSSNKGDAQIRNDKEKRGKRETFNLPHP